MKRTLFVFTLVFSFAALSDERSEKRQLVSELLEVIDARAMTQASFDNFMMTLSATFRDKGEEYVAPAEDIPEEYRAEVEASKREEEEKFREFRTRMFTRFDYQKYFDDVYVPMIEKQFTASELRDLIAFFKTKHGQKFARVLPDLGISAAGADLIMKAGDTTQKEIEKEEAARHPWRATMADLRTLATAVEARATDVNEYPQVGFEELEALITPTYIRVVPKVDSWGTPYLYVSDGQHYRFVSAGADKRFEWNARHLDLTTTEPRISESLDADIIFQDGNFLQSPKAATEGW
ncbi:MAG TPA: DUF2059 domain-containing protein [Thermoanaerobaculia bacterium]|jgi:hypothetical protein|nr:DUF2059 domain-containing protein [Thermoanaerobaculia bacterium]